MLRKPDYETGRFFISPLLGCNARCSFCYIYSDGYDTKASYNEFCIADTIHYIKSHKQFKLGRDGSIISIGAWGDPLPRYNKQACKHSLHWLSELAKLENPIQIMSRFELSDETVDKISNCNKYRGHILYSTSVSTFRLHRDLEPYSDAPELRLKSIQKVSKNGISTNVMIKPFLSNVTGNEINDFISMFNTYGVEYCVVGDLLIDKKITLKLSQLKEIPIKVETNGSKQVLDCTSGRSYEMNKSNEMLEFSASLEKLGIKVFRKSSCVNSYIINQPNPANYINNDPHGYCINCGVCEKTG